MLHGKNQSSLHLHAKKLRPLFPIQFKAIFINIYLLDYKNNFSKNSLIQLKIDLINGFLLSNLMILQIELINDVLLDCLFS